MRLAMIAPLFALAVAAAGCKPKPPTSPHCVHNTELQFKRIDDNHAKYKAGATPPGAVYWARYYLETARFVLTGHGLDGSGAACTGPDHASKDYERLLDGLEARSHDVEWIETQRGVKFKSLTGNSLKWTWQKTGEDVANNDANTL